MAAVLDVWVAEAHAACRVDDDRWRVDIFDAHTQPYSWGGRDYMDMAAPHGHWADTLPPGIYVVRARREKAAKGEPTVTDFAIVTVGCEGVTCVHLYVRPLREGREPERPKKDPRQEKEKRAEEEEEPPPR